MSAKRTDSLPLKEATAVLVKHFNLHEGLWSIAFDLKIGVGQFGPSLEEIYPGAMFGISSIFLLASEKEGPHVVDAAKVNPALKKPSQKPRAKTQTKG